MSFDHLRPSEIRYTQDSISNTFGNYGRYASRLIGESLDDILLGNCSVDDIPTIKVIKINNVWYSADNRRLWALKKVEELGKCTVIPVSLGYYLPDHKFTTENDGREINVRRNRNPGGSVWRQWAPKQSHSAKMSKTLYTQKQPIKTYDGNSFKDSDRHNDLENKNVVLQEKTLSGFRGNSDTAGYRSKGENISLNINPETGLHFGSEYKGTHNTSETKFTPEQSSKNANMDTLSGYRIERDTTGNSSGDDNILNTKPDTRLHSGSEHKITQQTPGTRFTNEQSDKHEPTQSTNIRLHETQNAEFRPVSNHRITCRINRRSASSRRTTEQLKKQRANLKQKAKAKVSEFKYPKTGGGLIAMPSPAVQVMIDQLEGTPGLEDIVGGIDTSDVIPMDTSYTEDTTLSNTVDMEVTLSYTVDIEVTDLPVIIHPSTSKKRKTELTEEILNLEKTKIEEEIKLIKERQTLAKLQTELSKLQISKINPAQTFDL